MADNTQVTAGAGDVMRSKDRSGVKTQFVGLDLTPNAAGETPMTAAALADATANPTVPLWAMCGLLYNGATWDRWRGDTANGLDVDVTRLPALATGANTIGKVDQGAGGASAWKMDGSAVTQPVSLVAVPTVTEKQDQPASSTATWTSATTVNTALTVSTSGYGTANVSIQVPTNVTAGVITLEVSDDNSVWYPAGAVRVDNGLQENVVTLALTPAIALNRMYSVSVDAMTQVRARLSTVTAGAGSVVVRIGTVAGGIEPFVAIRPRKVATYRAVFRATSHGLLSFAQTAGVTKQWATIHHAAAAVKTVKLRRVEVIVDGNTVGSSIFWELVRITVAPATANPAITASKASSNDPAHECTLMALPTTAGTEEAQPYATAYGDLGVGGALPTTRPMPLDQWWPIYDDASPDHDSKPPEIRAGVLEGWSVSCWSSATSTISGLVYIEFTEETP